MVLTTQIASDGGGERAPRGVQCCRRTSLLPTTCLLAFDGVRCCRRTSRCPPTCQLDSGPQDGRVLLQPLRSLAAIRCPLPPRWGCVGVPSAVRPPHPPRSLQGRPASLRSAAPLLDAGVGGSSVACGHPPQSLSRFLSLLSAVLGRHRGCTPSASPARRPVAARPRRAPLRGRLQCPRAGKRRPRRGVRPSGRVGASSAIGRVRGLRRARPARAGHRASAPGAGSRPHGPRPKGPGSSPRGHAQAALVVT